MICSCGEGVLGTEVSSLFTLVLRALPHGACCNICRQNKKRQRRGFLLLCRMLRTWSREEQIQRNSRRVRVQTLPYSKLGARCGNAMCSGTGHSQQDSRQGIAVWFNKRLCYACSFKGAPKDEGKHPARACHQPISERQQHITSHLKCAAQSTVTRSQHLYFTSGT